MKQPVVKFDPEGSLRVNLSPLCVVSVTTPAKKCRPRSRSIEWDRNSIRKRSVDKDSAR